MKPRARKLREWSTADLSAALDHVIEDIADRVAGDGALAFADQLRNELARRIVAPQQ